MKSTEPESSKGKGKKQSKSLITTKKWTPISTQMSRKPQNSESIQGTLQSQGTSQRTEKVFPEAEDQEEDILDTVVDENTLREIIYTLQITFQFNRNLKPEDWKEMDQVPQIHQLLKDLFQWTKDNKRFNLASHWAELGASCQKICPREISFKDRMEISKQWNPTGQFRLLEERATRIRENQAAIQAIDEQLNQTGPTLIPSGSQGVDQPNSPGASNHSATSRSVAKSPHSSKSQVISRKRQGYKGKSKTSFTQRQRESDPMIQKLFHLVKEVHNSKK
ncbi:hypothetical protein O181_010914 [Austropuccinia psidii MF-1]|uniref:Uncharacterized protein n=1 Tax=Austropuccinia psidii MF-1 TaxID=1389203 RepID=A0A9Q3BTK3_9BASI|nr:hypothetical protein [Austropuccinia psidii MF-1]